MATMNIEPPHEPATGLQWRKDIWPWSRLALEGVVTVGWVIAIGWTSVAFARWLFA
jgi:hypothetical protein